MLHEGIQMSELDRERLHAALGKLKKAAYTDTDKRGWTSGISGMTNCSVCDDKIKPHHIVYRFNQVMVAHSRCIKGIAANAPGDTIEDAELELMELLND